MSDACQYTNYSWDFCIGTMGVDNPLTGFSYNTAISYWWLIVPFILGIVVLWFLMGKSETEVKG